MPKLSPEVKQARLARRKAENKVTMVLIVNIGGARGARRPHTRAHTRTRTNKPNKKSSIKQSVPLPRGPRVRPRGLLRKEEGGARAKHKSKHKIHNKQKKLQKDINAILREQGAGRKDYKALRTRRSSRGGRQTRKVQELENELAEGIKWSAHKNENLATWEMVLWFQNALTLAGVGETHYVWAQPYAWAGGFLR